MTNYSDNPADVRVDFFKQSGKWYTTEKVYWSGDYNHQSIHDAFAISLREHFKLTPNRLGDTDAICLDPYHEYAHPIQIKNGGWIK